MNKKTLSFTLGSALASTLLSAAPAVLAGENPFAMSAIDTTHQLAAADEKTGEANCSAKMKESKAAEGKCGAEKMKEMKGKEGSCGANKKAEDASGKMTEGKCSASEKK